MIQVLPAVDIMNRRTLTQQTNWMTAQSLLYFHFLSPLPIRYQLWELRYSSNDRLTMVGYLKANFSMTQTEFDLQGAA